MSGRIAAIDCGTNSIKMLIADPPVVLHRESVMVRLGQGVDVTGELSDEALARTCAALDQFSALLAHFQVDRVTFCATSATRDASNAAVFAAEVEARLGVRPVVLSGAQEAQLTFIGAMNALKIPVVEPALVIDIGGGSTELIIGRNGVCESAFSMDIGAVRLHERHLHSDPPTEVEIAACIADIDAALEACPVNPESAQSIVGVAGTLMTLACGLLEGPAYDTAWSGELSVPRAGLLRLADDLIAMSVQERRALPFMHPGRADVIGAGALIVSRILLRSRVESVAISGAGILDGIAWSMTQP